MVAARISRTQVFCRSSRFRRTLIRCFRAGNISRVLLIAEHEYLCVRLCLASITNIGHHEVSNCVLMPRANTNLHHRISFTTTYRNCCFVASLLRAYAIHVILLILGATEKKICKQQSNNGRIQLVRHVLWSPQ